MGATRLSQGAKRRESPNQVSGLNRMKRCQGRDTENAVKRRQGNDPAVFKAAFCFYLGSPPGGGPGRTFSIEHAQFSPGFGPDPGDNLF